MHAQSALLAADTLIVVVSQSGRSAEMAQLLDLLATRPSRPFYRGRDQYRRLPLAARADFVVSLHAGPEFSVSCKIYLATLVALAWLTGCTE